MKVWVVTGESPTPGSDDEPRHVANQVAALRSAGHTVAVVTAAAPSLRHLEPIAGLLSRVSGRQDADLGRLPDLVGFRPGEAGAQLVAEPVDAAIEAALGAEADPAPRGPVDRARTLLEWGARGIAGAGRVTHDAVGNTVAVGRMTATMVGLMRRHGSPDVIHAHNVFPAGIAAAQFGPSQGVPVVVTEHASAYVQGRYSPVELAAAIRVLDRAAAVVAVSAVQAAALPIPTDRISVVPNAVLVDDFPLRTASARELGTVLAVGPLHAAKRMDVLMRAYAGLPAELRSRHRLHIVGSGPERQRLATLAGELGLGASVLLGQLNRDQVAVELSQAALMVSASTVETFPTALIEGLAAGVPFVATDSGGTREVAGPGLGRLVARNAPQALTSAIATMLNSPAQEHEDRARRAEAGGRFGPQALAQSLAEIYAGVGVTAP